MIKFTNNTTKLKVDKNDPFDLSEDVNNIAIEEIEKVKNVLSKISQNHEAVVIFSGKLGNVEISVNSESDNSFKIIQDLIQSC
jgi:hypothetical protein